MAPFIVLMLVPIVGIMALGGEVSSWYTTQRDLQHAADSAALAAAANDTTTLVSGVESYKNEAYGMTGSYGYKSAGDVTVTPTKVSCPDGSGVVCYQVIVSRKVPLYLTRVIGYYGNTTLADGRSGTLVSALSIAKHKVPGNAFCITSIGTGNKDGITMNGIPKTATPNCDYRSNTTAECNGSNEPASNSYYSGGSVGSKACSASDHPNSGTICDPFYDCTTVSQNIDSLIPPEQAGECPTVGSGKSATKYPHTTTNGVINAAWTGVKKICGTANLSGTVSLNGNATLVIYNGELNLNAGTLKTTGSGGLTIIFAKGSSTDGSAVNPNVNGGGTLDFAAPTDMSQSFHGIALVIDRDYSPLKTNDTFKAAGSYTLKMTGLLYAPSYPVEVAGAIDKSASGYNCMAILTKSFTLDGSGTLYSSAALGPTSECDLASLNNLPKVPDTRQALVQ